MGSFGFVHCSTAQDNRQSISRPAACLFCRAVSHPLARCGSVSGRGLLLLQPGHRHGRVLPDNKRRGGVFIGFANDFVIPETLQTARIWKRI